MSLIDGQLLLDALDSSEKSKVRKINYQRIFGTSFYLVLMLQELRVPHCY